MEMEGEGRRTVGIRDAFHKIILKSSHMQLLALCLLGVTCGSTCGRVDDVVEKTLKVE